MPQTSLYTKRIFTGNLKDHLDENVEIFGWIHVRRDQGKMIFFEIRDKDGLVQGVVLPNKTEALEVAKKIRDEFVVKVIGKINKRPDRNIQAGVFNGDIEMEIEEIEIINESETPPYNIHDSKDVNEEVRLKYRYLDLRGKRVHDNVIMRDKIVAFFRKYMRDEGFVEIETPILMKGTPEGSREFLVPSRLHNGMFYALPQSPQQFKQLLMVAGFERYFQIARCMRDEDQRGDRQPEFTQLDFEMSFIDQETILQYTERMFIELVMSLYPNKKISFHPFPRLTYAQSLEKYGSDKPDLRVNKEDPDELAFAWIVDFPMYEKMKDGSISTAHHPFCSTHPDDEEIFMNAKAGSDELLKIRANSYDLVLNGL
jgi:aspartyl-tRNA synthetase